MVLDISSSAAHRQRGVGGSGGSSQQQPGWRPASAATSAPSRPTRDSGVTVVGASGSEEAISRAFSYDGRLWLKASANMHVKELWRECEKRLKVGFVPRPESPCTPCPYPFLLFVHSPYFFPAGCSRPQPRGDASLLRPGADLPGFRKVRPGSGGGEGGVGGIPGGPGRPHTPPPRRSGVG